MSVNDMDKRYVVRVEPPPSGLYGLGSEVEYDDPEMAVRAAELARSSVGIYARVRVISRGQPVGHRSTEG